MLLYILGPLIALGIAGLIVLRIKHGSFDFGNEYYKLTGNFSVILHAAKGTITIYAYLFVKLNILFEFLNL
jgi:hypothetical protein